MTTNGIKSAELADLKGRVKVLQSAAASDKETIEVLIWLKKNVVATEALLRETKAGLAVGKLRTHTSKTVADIAKELVKKWKAEVDRAKAKTPGAASTGSNGNSTAAPSSTAGSVPGTPQPRPSIDTSVRGPSSVHSPLTPGLSSATANGAERSAKTDGIPAVVYHEQTRDTCLVMIYNALCIGSSIPPARLHEVSKAVENAVYTMNGSEVSPAYRSKLRSLYLNLKEKTNPGLRQAVASGEISPERLCSMSSKEMASDERKQEDKKLSEANFHQALGSEELAAETDAFQCGRCKQACLQRKTRYYQQQTRSADEPMTTFVTCTHCGHKWKFS